VIEVVAVAGRASADIVGAERKRIGEIGRMYMVEILRVS
jgi:hypothetical protein